MVVGFGDALAPGFETCIHDDNTIYQDVSSAIALLERKNSVDTLKAIKILAKVAEILPKAV